MKPSEQDLTALKGQHGSVYTYELGGGEHVVAIKRAKSFEYRRFMQRVSDGNKFDAMQELALSCVVWPEQQKFIALLDEYPGYAIHVAGQLVSLAENSEKVDAKKA